MRVAGTRSDGALWLNLDGGLAVVLRGDACSSPVDPLIIERMGPWADAHGVTGGDRRELAKRLNQARTVALSVFALDTRHVKVTAVHGKKKMKFEYTVNDPNAVGVEPEAVAAPAPTGANGVAEEATEPVSEVATEDEATEPKKKKAPATEQPDVMALAGGK